MSEQPKNQHVDIAEVLRMLACTCAEPQISDVLTNAADLIDDLRVLAADLAGKVEKLSANQQTPIQEGSGGTK
jgi:hypothetical protein